MHGIDFIRIGDSSKHRSLSLSRALCTIDRISIPSIPRRTPHARAPPRAPQAAAIYVPFYLIPIQRLGGWKGRMLMNRPFWRCIQRALRIKVGGVGMAASRGGIEPCDDDQGRLID